MATATAKPAAAKPPKALGKSSTAKAKAPAAKAAAIPVAEAPVVALPKAKAAPAVKAPAAKATQTRTKAKTQAAKMVLPAAIKASPAAKAKAKAAEVITPEAEVAVIAPIAETVHEVKIKHTNKLDIFKWHPANRKVVQAKVKNLIQQITENNLLHLNPIIVDDEMRVVNGQHRWMAAKALGLTLYYVKGKVTDKQMLDLNANQKSLVLKDYLDSYVAQGLEEYKKVAEFIDRNKIVLYNAIGLLSGRNSQPNSDLVNMFKNGEFKVKDLEHAERVLQVRDKMEEFARDFYSQKNFTNAVAKVISADGFDEDRLMTRLKKNGHGQLHQAVTTDLYVDQILDVYNYGVPKKNHLHLESN